MAAAASTGPSGDLASQVLLILSKKDPVLSVEAFPDSNFAELRSALARLASRSMIAYEQLEREEAVLESEGEQIAEHGSHEARVFEALSKALGGLTVAELEKAVGDKNVAKIGQSRAFKEKWISRTKDGKFVASVCAMGLHLLLCAS